MDFDEYWDQIRAANDVDNAVALKLSVAEFQKQLRLAFEAGQLAAFDPNLVTSRDASMKDVTKLVERLELFEERLGVTLEALFVGMDSEGSIYCTGEIHPKTGTTLSEDLCLTATCHDAAGRVLAKSGESIFKGKFYGFMAFDIHFYRSSLPDTKVARIRIYPEKMWKD